MENTDFTDYAKYLETVAPEIVEEFNKGYIDPAYLGGTCQRCFADVTRNTTRHSDYHRALSLVLFAMGSTLNSMAQLFGGNEIKKRLDER